MTRPPTRIVHVITALDIGGAEMMLFRLLRATDRRRFDPVVISLTQLGRIGTAIAEIGIPVRALELKGNAPHPFRLVRLARWLRELRAQVVQTWMHDSDLVGGLAAKVAGRVPVAWGIHAGIFDLSVPALRRVYAVALASAALSRFVPARIVCCSETSRRVHGALGYDRSRMIVIPNGFDLDLFRPDPAARATLRAELGLPPDALLIGQIGRFHPQKDYRTFIQAAAIARRERPALRFVLCGAGLDDANRELTGWIAGAGLTGAVHLLGRRDDGPRVLAALDVYSSSSAFGEAFPLVLGEAMACGVPCVSTDVGDADALLGATGRPVPARDPVALAAGWRALLELGPEGRARLGAAAREHIASRFSIGDITERYAALHEEIAHVPSPAMTPRDDTP